MQPKDTSRQEKPKLADQTSVSPSLEKIRPELNLEKWSIWKPAKSQNAPKARILERKVTLPDGSKMTGKVKVGFTDEGELTTEDQKTYYALVKQWEDNGRSDQYTSFSTRKLAKLLKKKWGTNVIEAVTKSLIRLRATPFTWENSYYDNSTEETVELLETFNILSELKIVRRKKDGVVNKEVGYFKFNDFTLKNLLANHTKPLLFEVVISFRSEIAQLLYTYLELILFDKPIYERRTKELFDDLGLEGDSYKNPSNRKQKLEPALKELQGAPLTSGAIISATLERTKDDEDYKIVIRKGARKSVKLSVPNQGADKEEEKGQAASLLSPQSQLTHQAETLVSLFYELFHSNANAHISSKAVGQAMSLIAQHGFDQAKHIVNFSHQVAPETDYHPQTFGGILQYTTRALVAYERFHTEQKQAEEQRAAENARLKAEEEQERQAATTRAEAQTFFEQLPTEEQQRLMRHYRAQALERNPILLRCSEEVVEREVLRELLRAISAVPTNPTPSPQPTQERLFDQEQLFSTDTTIELPQQTMTTLEAISGESASAKELTPLDTVSQTQSITEQGSEDLSLLAQQPSMPSTDQPDQAPSDSDTST